jgi:hypothetical protein
MMKEEERTMMSEEDRFRSMAEEGIDRSFDKNLPIFRSEVAERLGEMEWQMESPLYKRRGGSTLSYPGAQDTG